MAFSLVRSLVRSALRNLGDHLVGGGIVPVGSIAIDIYEDWRAVGDEVPGAPEAPRSAAEQAHLRAELERVVQDVRAYRQQVEELLAEMAAGQPEEILQCVRTYLQQVPGRVQASLRRPEDPSGKTIPPALPLGRAEDLHAFLPDRMPRFKAGDCPLPGTDLVVHELLGVGGFGEVWKAVHKNRPHAPPVALKFCTDEAAASTLRKEVELLDRVATQGRHRGIVELRYAHLESSTPCLEYEFVDGGDLAVLIAEMHRGQKAQPLRLAKIMLALAQAVGHAHRLKPPIVHRDLKPANILTMRLEGKFTLKVADFGIGGLVSDKALSAWATETQRSAATGSGLSAGSCTPLYASPQQRRFGPVDPRDDVYALGVIWYQMLAGDMTREPPRGGSWKKRFREQGASSEMLALLESCLEDEPADRPADAQVLADRLARLVQAPAPQPMPPPIPEEPPVPVILIKEDWYYIHDGEQTGPLSMAELKERAAAGKVLPSDMVWTNRLSDWVEANTIPDLCSARAAGPPPLRSKHIHLLLVVPPAIHGLPVGARAVATDFFKIYLDGVLLGEGPYQEQFNLETDSQVGEHTLDVAHWRGNREVARKTINLSCKQPGDYKLRFNYVRGLMGGMNQSTLEYLKVPRS